MKRSKVNLKLENYTDEALKVLKNQLKEELEKRWLEKCDTAQKENKVRAAKREYDRTHIKVDEFTYLLGENIVSSKLKMGDTFMVDGIVYNFIHMTDDFSLYGENPKKTFESVKACYDHYKVRGLSALEKLQDKNGHGYSSYMTVMDVATGKYGAWFYAYRGRWAYGSGAAHISFQRATIEKDSI